MTRMTVIGWMALGAILGLYLANDGARVRSADQPNDAMLKRLLRERIMLNREIVGQLKKIQVANGVSKLEMLGAERNLLVAEFDAAQTKDERIAVLTKLIDHEKKVTELKNRTSTGSGIEHLQDQIRDVDAQIALEKEKLRTKPTD